MRASGDPGVAPRMDAIRSQLRALGYLKGPLAGWMLPGGGPSSFLRLNLSSSLRVGIVGGPLLGIPAAAAVALSNRPHLSEPADLALLTLYMSLALGAALGLLQLAADTILAWFARRGLVLIGDVERLAGRVGLLLAGASALYLAALLRAGGPPERARPEGAPLAWMTWAASVLLVLGAGHLIWRLTRLSSLIALLATGSPMGEPSTPARRRIRGLSLAATVLLGAGVSIMLLPGDREPGARGAPPAIHPGEFKGRVVFVGVDGLDSRLLDGAISSGLVPRLARMEREGARFDLAAPAPRVPPAVWTTIATGRRPEEHGVLGFQSARLPGLATRIQEPAAGDALISPNLLIPPLGAGRAPVSGGMRRAPAVWEIAGDAGLQSASINWWATWPALDGSATVVSEVAFARLESGRAPDREIHPPALQAELHASFQDDLAAARSRAIQAAGAGSSGRVSVSAEIDGYHVAIARRLLARRQHRLLMLYLPGLDLVRSAAAPEGAGPGAQLAAERALRLLDQLVADISGDLDRWDTLMVMGEPGRTHGQNGAPRGVVLATGARVKSGRLNAAAGPLDITPTLLAMLGLPMAADLPGAPVLDFLTEDDVAWRLPPAIPTYGASKDSGTSQHGDEFDQEVLDRLRSLGYIR